MKFLTKFGQVALRVIGIVTGILPMVGAAIPGTRDDLVIGRVLDTSQQIGSVIGQVELFGQALGLKGADKLKGAAPALAQVILQSAALAGHKVKNEELFRQGVLKVGDGWADIYNSLDDNGVKVENRV